VGIIRDWFPTMSAIACVICASASIRLILRTNQLALFQCRVCGHTIADHGHTSANLPDYHVQYGGDFAAALEQTRRRQAHLIVDALNQLGADDRLVDFGCGRGWFLDEFRRRGVPHLAGLDTSSLAVTLLRERGIEAQLLPLPQDGSWSIPALQLSFRGQTVAFLDVVEHFPPLQIKKMFAAIVGAFHPHLRQIVVKVPISAGLLYRLSFAAARIGVTRPIEQLYQVGTFPPHYHYFSRRSLLRFLSDAGFEVARAFGDADFDSAGFGDRVGFLRGLPKPVGTMVGRTLLGTAILTRQFDSIVVIARPISAGSPEYRELVPATGAEIRE
jgi:SAM-dependent methyltransferase